MVLSVQGGGKNPEGADSTNAGTFNIVLSHGSNQLDIDVLGDKIHEGDADGSSTLYRACLPFAEQPETILTAPMKEHFFHKILDSFGISGWSEVKRGPHRTVIRRTLHGADVVIDSGIAAAACQGITGQ